MEDDAGKSRRQKKNEKKRFKEKALDDFEQMATEAAEQLSTAGPCRSPESLWEEKPRANQLLTLAQLYMPIVEAELQQMGEDPVIDIPAKAAMIRMQPKIVKMMAHEICVIRSKEDETHATGVVCMGDRDCRAAEDKDSPSTATHSDTGAQGGTDVQKLSLSGGHMAPSQVRPVSNEQEAPEIQQAYAKLWQLAEEEARAMAAQAPPGSKGELHGNTVHIFRVLKKRWKSKQKSKAKLRTAMNLKPQ